MLTKGRKYKVESDNDLIILEDSETHEFESIQSDSVYIFEGSEQIRRIPGVVTLSPGDMVECILVSPITFGVDKVYYAYEHTIAYMEQNNIIEELFPYVTYDELSLLHEVLIPYNLRNDVISTDVLKQLITNFVKQSLAVFARPVYESTKNQTKREIVMKLIFGVNSCNKVMELSSTNNLIVISDKNHIGISYLEKIVSWYEYPDMGEED